ncbi:unnamed protein product [Cunninghamella blakesleeana]
MKIPSIKLIPIVLSFYLKATNAAIIKQKRIIGGTPVKDDTEYPFSAYLSIEFFDCHTQCGATIISNTTLVTAAHCVVDIQTGTLFPPHLINIGVGSKSISKAFMLKADRIDVHPGFSQPSKTTSVNDIAVIHVNELSKYINNIDLTNSTKPHVSTIPIYNGPLPNGTKLKAIGWGQTIANTDEDSTVDDLQQTDLIIGNNKECHQYFPSYQSSDGPYICTQNKANPSSDTCQGDNGGALIITLKDKVYLAGVTSFGGNVDGDTSCALPDGFSIFTHVYHYLSFITDGI